ncbi:hypothetical protein HMJ29_14135 [Hymenobacter taeanensis]|uniref:Uncharacterized protein n=1 Tax=Hymenobacter taeanensis TaxID=2735321 RepID=A0A6M6BLP7_9BACT|nr:MULTISPECIES: hypothetical protein [Hymenobacter]QJX48015.1 hypothetical protein HMJ29_14135 [Hymenobacter taeanensis]UOQ82535.1 hypothetical protein MUN83_07165 [Hymenobacter sp. 5414T-23]
MKKFTLLLAFALLSAAPAVLAQSAYKVPTNYTLQRPEDYAEYNKEVVATVDWLEKTPSSKEPEKRREANRFLFQWISGTPDVSVQMQKYVADLTAQDPDLLLLFMGGWARYQIQHPEVKDPVVLNTEGIKTVLKAYQSGGNKRNKHLDSLVELNAKGTLADWVRKQLAG